MRGLIVYIACRSSKSSEGTRASCGSGVHILESTRPMCDGVAPRTLHARTLDVWIHAVAGAQWGLSVWNLASEASGRSIESMPPLSRPHSPDLRAFSANPVDRYNTPRLFQIILFLLFNQKYGYSLTFPDFPDWLYINVQVHRSYTMWFLKTC